MCELQSCVVSTARIRWASTLPSHGSAGFSTPANRSTPDRLPGARRQQHGETHRTPNADLWDSGKVASDQSILLPYGGKPLRSHIPCVLEGPRLGQDRHARRLEPARPVDDGAAECPGLAGGNGLAMRKTTEPTTSPGLRGFGSRKARLKSPPPLPRIAFAASSPCPPIVRSSAPFFNTRATTSAAAGSTIMTSGHETTTAA